jgi:hypothetical protein
VAYVLVPTAAEATLGITAEQFGVRALPADAGPELRAHAEAVWRPQTDPARPCRCRHCEACEAGRLVHVDRHPGSLWGVATWWDTYECRLRRGIRWKAAPPRGSEPRLGTPGPLCGARQHKPGPWTAVVSGGCQDLPSWVNGEVLPRWLQFGLG